jgi:hypothetical protein
MVNAQFKRIRARQVCASRTQTIKAHTKVTTLAEAFAQLRMTKATTNAMSMPATTRLV